ncbi:alpha/beta-hydrolase [Lactarius deliciosus]|nr:alpha/beta-hydrolase [Lactarius deliciosus]
MGIHVPPAYQPVVRHTLLKTTFTGLQHTLSTAELPIHQYRGIKYASIPARFRQAKLFTSYRSSTDATRYGPICPQPKGKTNEEELFAFTGAETSAQNFKQIESECLNLNITCPGGLTRESRLPVMVWVHGFVHHLLRSGVVSPPLTLCHRSGGDRGSGSHWLYDGGPLVQNSMRLGKPIVLVTINYRLGLLGCAASPKLLEDNKLAGEEGVGNYGLRDQRRALEWVHDFIADFGGDGSNITLFGASTGASDILSHLNSTSNGSHPLFARAIVQSPITEPNLPSVSLVGVHLSKVMSALRVSTIQELRKVPIDKLNASVENRAAEEVPQNHLQVPEKLTAQCVIEQHIVDTHGTLPSRIGAKVLQVLHRDNLALVHRPRVPAASQQPVIIGDCNFESFGYAPSASAWTPSAVVRRVGAICQSVKKANALLRAYDISAHTPDEEFPERLLELINDARFAWPTHLIAETASRTTRRTCSTSSTRRARPLPRKLLLATPDPDTFFPDRFDVDDDDDDDAPFDNSAFDSAFDDGSSDGEPMPSVDQYQYGAVRDALQARWLAFAYGQAPWSRDKVFVFGPEGEAGERGTNIFESRRRTAAWRTALEPLGRALVQKVGLELSNGPSGAQLMHHQHHHQHMS